MCLIPNEKETVRVKVENKSIVAYKVVRASCKLESLYVPEFEYVVGINTSDREEVSISEKEWSDGFISHGLHVCLALDEAMRLAGDEYWVLEIRNEDKQIKIIKVDIQPEDIVAVGSCELISGCALRPCPTCDERRNKQMVVMKFSISQEEYDNAMK